MSNAEGVPLPRGSSVHTGLVSYSSLGCVRYGGLASAGFFPLTSKTAILHAGAFGPTTRGGSATVWLVTGSNMAAGPGPHTRTSVRPRTLSTVITLTALGLLSTVRATDTDKATDKGQHRSSSSADQVARSRQRIAAASSQRSPVIAPATSPPVLAPPPSAINLPSETQHFDEAMQSPLNSPPPPRFSALTPRQSGSSQHNSHSPTALQIAPPPCTDIPSPTQPGDGTEPPQLSSSPPPQLSSSPTTKLTVSHPPFVYPG